MLLPFDTITRTSEFDDRAATLHLRPWQWRLLLAADGRTRLDDLASGCGISFETAADLVHETEALGLIAIVTQTLEDYRAMHAPLAEPISLESLATSVESETAPVAAPMKKLSVSFDALNSMFGDPTPAAVAPTPRIEYAPFASETPDHMAPYVEHASLEEAPVVEAVPAVAPESPSKSVSFSLFATNFGNPEAPLVYEPETHDTHHEIASNGHAAMTEFAAEPIFEHEATNGAVHVHAAVHDSIDTAHEVFHEHIAEQGATIADVAVPESPKDDILLQHYYVGANGKPTDPTLDADSAKSNGDLTGNLLRALGLKK